MFDVKICGVRFKSDVQAVAAAAKATSHSAGRVAIGLNFFAPSVRYVDPTDPATTELSRAAAKSGLLRVGVFVNETPKAIAQVVGHLGLAAVQLHGDEMLEDLGAITEIVDVSIIRAIKLPTGKLSTDQIHEVCLPWWEMDCHLLLDADAGVAHGGSGKTLDWPSIKAWSDQSPEIQWTLAGGLTPENVAEAINESGAISVDTASGVEESRGVKSVSRIASFIELAS